MNLRIQELAQQADEYAEQTVHYYMGQFDGLTWEGKIKQTRDIKFAELIVRECIARVEGCAVEFDDNHPNDQFIAGYNKGVSKTASQVKQHFGVEE